MTNKGKVTKLNIMKAKATHVSKLQFNLVSDSNHAIVVDASTKLSYDHGSRPKELLLMSLISCTGMDVVSLLNKMRVEFDKFSVSAEAENAEMHPKVFKYVNIKYFISGKSIDKKKLEKAINLSQDRYCPVTAMMKKACKINHSYEISEGI
ncbi:MAG: OsmC family protein [Candidatus Cloacimonadota bacterium]|nr:OsmC family protein [Candidatus Cloacimonadota bacterium]